MGLVFYGVSEKIIDVDEFFIRCASCEAHAWADVLVISKYWHLYWIPVFPIEKEANVFCKQCGLKRIGIPFNEKLVSNYSEIKNKFRHKWYLYSGLGSVLLLVLFSILSNLSAE